MSSTSRMSSQIGESPWTTLQLTRFSHATSENLNPAHVNWVHIPERDDLVLVLDFSQVMSSDGQWQDSKVLKVLRGAAVMERLDLKSLVRVAVAEESRIRELKLPISESRVSTLIRSPCVAIRYITSENKIRRFQLRFPSHQVFESALSILKSIGLPLHHALPSNNTSAGTASIRPDSSSTARDQFISSQETLSVVKSPELPPKRIEYQEPHRDAPISSLLPSPAFLGDSSLAKRRSTSDFSMPPPDNRHRSAGTLSSTNQGGVMNAQGSFLQGPEALPRPTTTPAFVPQMPDSLSQVLPPRRILPFDLPAHGPGSKTTDVSAALENTQSLEAANASESSATRKPGTRGGKQPAKPKPKPKPKSKTEPKPVKAPRAKKGKNGEVVAPAPAPTPPETTSSGVLGLRAEMNGTVDAPDAIPAPHPVEPPLPAPSLGVTTSESSLAGRKRPSAEMEVGQDDEQAPLSAACPTCQQPLTKPASEDGQRKRRLPSPQANQTLSAAPPTPDEVLPEHLNHNEAAVSRYPTQPPPNANYSLAAYAAQSDKDRLAAVDTFLCQNLMDDDFLTLCEDVERSWRRIGLGSSQAAGGSRVSQRISQISKFADAALFENLCCD